MSLGETLARTAPPQKYLGGQSAYRKLLNATGHKKNTKENGEIGLNTHWTGCKLEGPTAPAPSVSADGEELERVTLCRGDGGVWDCGPDLESWRYLPEPNLCLPLTNGPAPGSPRRTNDCVCQMALFVAAFFAMAQTWQHRVRE